MIGNLVSNQFKDYTIKSFGNDIWEKINRKAGENQDYWIADPEYRREISTLISALTKETGFKSSYIMESFGFFMVPNFLRDFSVYIKPYWKTLETLEEFNSIINKFKKLEPHYENWPLLKIIRVDKNQVNIENFSYKYLNLIIGLVRGLASYFNEVNYISLSVYSIGEICKIEVQRK